MRVILPQDSESTHKIGFGLQGKAMDSTPWCEGTNLLHITLRALNANKYEDNTNQIAHGTVKKVWRID